MKFQLIPMASQSLVNCLLFNWRSNISRYYFLRWSMKKRSGRSSLLTGGNQIMFGISWQKFCSKMTNYESSQYLHLIFRCSLLNPRYFSFHLKSCFLSRLPPKSGSLGRMLIWVPHLEETRTSSFRDHSSSLTHCAWQMLHWGDPLSRL